MAEYLVWSGSGVTEVQFSTAYNLGDRIVIHSASSGTNYLVARRYVWECTTAGTTGAAHPTYLSSYTPDVSTLTHGTAVFTCRNPGFSSGSTKDWTFATPWLRWGVYAARVNGDVLKVHKTHSELWGGDITLIPQADCSIICVDKDANEARATMGASNVIGNSGNWWFVISPVAACTKLYIYGLTFRAGAGGTTAETVGLQASDVAAVFDNCYLWHANTGAGQIRLTGVGGEYSVHARYKDCVFRFGGTASYIEVGEGRTVMEGCSISPDGASPAVLFGEDQQGPGTLCVGCDFSKAGIGTLVGNINTGYQAFEFVNCKFPTGVAMMSAQTVTGLNSTEITVSNCSSGDTHYNWGYYTTAGSVEAVTDVSMSAGGALWDGINNVSWKVTTTAACSELNMFTTPWIDKYHDGVAAITPYLEILRNDSVTPYQNDEVWGEFSYQGETGSTRSLFVNDRMEYPPSLITTPADQANGIGLVDWSGESGTAWSGKLAPGAAITPAEIGFLRARVCVAQPSTVLYVDPKIRT